MAGTLFYFLLYIQTPDLIDQERFMSKTHCCSSAIHLLLSAVSVGNLQSYKESDYNAIIGL